MRKRCKSFSAAKAFVGSGLTGASRAFSQTRAYAARLSFTAGKSSGTAKAILM